MSSLRTKRVYALIIAACAATMMVSSCSRKPASFEKKRKEMVRTQIEQRGITQPEILKAFLTVPREEFVIEKFKEQAHDDVEAPIGYEQSLDRPYENALMILALDIDPGERALEVGTGSGYLASLMAQIADEVYTILGVKEADVTCLTKQLEEERENLSELVTA